MSERVDVKKFLVISAAIVGLALTLLVQSHAQERVRSVPSGGTPLVREALVNGPVPRLPDGKVDLTGPWLGGGSNVDIEREGGVNEFTLEDPGALSRPVQLKFTAKLLRPDLDLMEFICTEDNQAGIAGGYKLNSEQR